MRPLIKVRFRAVLVGESGQNRDTVRKKNKNRVEIEALLRKGGAQRFIARRYGTTEANFSNWMKKNGITAKKKDFQGIFRTDNSLWRI